MAGLAKIDGELAEVGITGFRNSLNNCLDYAGEMVSLFQKMQGTNKINDDAFEVGAIFEKNYNTYLEESVDVMMGEVAKVADIEAAMNKVSIGSVSNVVIEEDNNGLDTSELL